MANAIDGILDNWIPCQPRKPGFENETFILGVITGDSKGRFEDGTTMTTSILTSPRSDVAEGALIATLNSCYQLGKRREIDAETVVSTIILHADIINTDGSISTPTLEVLTVQ